MTADLRKLLDAATKGPWKRLGGTARSNPTIYADGGNVAMMRPRKASLYAQERPMAVVIADADLIVAAVNALPALLSVCEAAKRHMAASDRVQDDSSHDAMDEFNAAYNALRRSIETWEKQ